jgi:hypothetical protein
VKATFGTDRKSRIAELAVVSNPTCVCHSAASWETTAARTAGAFSAK